MQKLKDSFYRPVEEGMLAFFRRMLYQPLLDTLATPQAKLNDVSALREAIRSGRIQYRDGVFSGQFSAATSRELAAFATFDRRSRVWRGDPPPDIKGVAIIADSKRKALATQLQRALDDAAGRIDEAIATLSFGSDLPLFAMDQDIRRDLHDIGILPELSSSTEAYLRKNYSEAQNLNIKNWMPDQVARLREMVQRIQTSGDAASIQDAIAAEWGTTAAKAAFLARQETSLFLEAQPRAGIGRRRAPLSLVDVARRAVRESHKHLDGLIIDFDRAPIVEIKTGRRAHAGEDFNCRCGKIWMLD